MFGRKHRGNDGDNISISSEPRKKSMFGRLSRRRRGTELEEDPTAYDPEVKAINQLDFHMNDVAGVDADAASHFGNEGPAMQPEAAWFGNGSKVIRRAVNPDTQSFGGRSTSSRVSELTACDHNFQHATPLVSRVPSTTSSQRVANGGSPAAENSALQVLIREARNLMAADSNGKSDPFVVVQLGTKKEKTKVVRKTTDPTWNADFIFPCPQDSPNNLELHVYDKDPLRSDYMGSVTFDHSQIGVGDEKSLALPLKDLGKARKPLPSALGVISFDVKRVSQLQRRAKTKKSKKVGSRLVTVEVIEAWDLQPWDDNGYADPYVKLSIGSQKRKSKVCPKTLQPTWKERFEFPLHDQVSQLLNIKLMDRDYGGSDELMGGCSVDLSKLAMDQTHPIIKPLGRPEDGEIRLNITITDFFARKSLVKLEDLDTKEAMQYVGSLKVEVINARGLAAKDMGGTSDPFVICELGNQRLRSRTIDKTVNPVWDETLEFYVRDVFDVLRLTVYDEDKGGKKEFLGALIIPLLEIRNGLKDYWPLKSNSLTNRAKGEIQLKLHIDYNKFRAYPKVIKPREQRHMDEDPKLKLPVLKNNIRRVTQVILGVVNGLKFVDALFKWEHGWFWSFLAMLFWCWATLYLQAYHLPFLIAVRLGYNYITDPKAKTLTTAEDVDYDAYASEDEDEEEPDKPSDKKAKQGFRERFRALQTVGQNIQNKLGDVASMGEKFKNLCNWSIPVITAMVVTILCIASVALYIINIRYILFIVGLRRFLQLGYRKYISKPAPRKGPSSNPIAELLGRIPNDIERIQRRKLKLLGGRRAAARPHSADQPRIEEADEFDPDESVDA